MAALALACARAPAHRYDLAIPAAEDWLDCGAMLEAGQPGDWDRLLWGGFAATALNTRKIWLHASAPPVSRNAGDRSQAGAWATPLVGSAMPTGYAHDLRENVG